MGKRISKYLEQAIISDISLIKKVFPLQERYFKFEVEFVKDSSFLNNNLIFYIENRFSFYNELTNFIPIFNYHKKIFENIQGNFYIIKNYQIYWYKKLNFYYCFYPIKNGFLDNLNIKVLIDFGGKAIKPSIFHKEQKDFITIVNKEYIINDMIKQFLIINKEIIESDPKIKISISDISSFFAIVYGIYNKYGGITNEFLKDLNDMKQKMIETYKKFNIYNFKDELKKIPYNTNMFPTFNNISVTLNAIYILLTNDYRIFLAKGDGNKDNYLEEKKKIEIGSLARNYLFNVLKGNSLEELVMKHALYTELNKNGIDFLFGDRAEKFFDIITNIYKNYFNNNLNPNVYNILKNTIIENIEEYKKLNKEHYNDNLFRLDSILYDSYDKFLENLEHKLKLSAIDYKKEYEYKKVFNKQLGL